MRFWQKSSVLMSLPLVRHKTFSKGHQQSSSHISAGKGEHDYHNGHPLCPQNWTHSGNKKMDIPGHLLDTIDRPRVSERGAMNSTLAVPLTLWPL